MVQGGSSACRRRPAGAAAACRAGPLKHQHFGLPRSLPPQGEAGGVGEGEVVQGLAFLSMLFNTSYVVRARSVHAARGFVAPCMPSWPSSWAGS